MIDHIGIPVKDFEKCLEFYKLALKPLGYELLMEFHMGKRIAGFGAQGKPDFWVEEGDPFSRIHVAFLATSRGLVDAFHAAALAAGGQDNGAPGLRPQYHPDYYGAFVIDPSGYNIEAVCHRPA